MVYLDNKSTTKLPGRFQIPGIKESGPLNVTNTEKFSFGIVSLQKEKKK